MFVGMKNKFNNYVLLTSLFFLCCQSKCLHANPLMKDVIAGEVRLSSENNSLIINQTTDKAIIHWKDFSLKEGELTKFIYLILLTLS